MKLKSAKQLCSVVVLFSSLAACSKEKQKSEHTSGSSSSSPAVQKETPPGPTPPTSSPTPVLPQKPCPPTREDQTPSEPPTPPTPPVIPTFEPKKDPEKPSDLPTKLETSSTPTQNATPPPAIPNPATLPLTSGTPVTTAAPTVTEKIQHQTPQQPTRYSKKTPSSGSKKWRLANPASPSDVTTAPGKIPTEPPPSTTNADRSASTAVATTTPAASTVSTTTNSGSDLATSSSSSNASGAQLNVATSNSTPVPTEPPTSTTNANRSASTAVATTTPAASTVSTTTNSGSNLATSSASASSSLEVQQGVDTSAPPVPLDQSLDGHPKTPDEKRRARSAERTPHSSEKKKLSSRSQPVSLPSSNPIRGFKIPTGERADHILTSSGFHLEVRPEILFSTGEELKHTYFPPKELDPTHYYTLRYGIPSNTDATRFTLKGLNTNKNQIGTFILNGLIEQLDPSDADITFNNKLFPIAIIQNVKIATTSSSEAAKTNGSNIIGIAAPSFESLAISRARINNYEDPVEMYKIFLSFYAAFSIAKQNTAQQKKILGIHIDTENWVIEEQYKQLELPLMIALQIVAARGAGVQTLKYFYSDNNILQAVELAKEKLERTDKNFSEYEAGETVSFMAYLNLLL